MMNTYDRNNMILSGIVGVLALLYAGTLVFDPETVNARNASFTWLDPKWADQADRIELSGAEQTVTLLRKDSVWYVSRNNTDYPAKQLRIADMLGILTANGRYPVRGASGAALERFGVTEEAASRLIIRGGASAYPLLDLLIGNVDGTGRERYLRRNGETEVRSGEDRVSSYVDGTATAWFNLRLFPETLKPEAVQGVTIYAPPASAGAPTPAPLTLARKDGGWTVQGAPLADGQRAESYLRSLLEAEGEDFIDSDTVFSDPPEGRLVLELGNGQSLTVTAGPLSAANRRAAAIEGNPFRYALAEWTATRLFRDAAYFQGN